METGCKKPVVLIVDDEPDICEMLAKILSGEGYVVNITDSGKMAVKKVMDECADIVLLDIVMPGQNGIETLRQIKAVQPDLPVVMITAFGTLTTVQEALKFGAFDYITKPFDIECVKEVIKQRLEERRICL